MIKQSKKSRGFTLVELMAVVAIVGVLGALAYPSYLQSVRKSNRAEAKSELSDAIQRFQRCYTVHGTFKPSAGCQVYDDLKAVGATYTSKGKGLYKIKLQTAPAISNTKVTVIAVADKAPQTTDKKTGLDCTELSLDQNGVRLPADCW